MLSIDTMIGLLLAVGTLCVILLGGLLTVAILILVRKI